MNINSIIKRFFLIALILALVVSNSFLALKTIYAALADSADIFTVSNPVPNSNLRGTVNIDLKAYDDDRGSIRYTIGLYDASTCIDNFYGNVVPGSTVPSSSTTTSTISWDTTKTLSNPSIQDGNYCLKVCLVLHNGSSPYSACNARNVRLINYNRAPSITSNPSKLQYTEGESFSYQMTATDPDGDNIIYRFITTPGFLTINPLTGLITSGPLSSYGNGFISYSITVGVDDGINPTVNQTFTLTVNQAQSTGGKNGGSTQNNNNNTNNQNTDNNDDEDTTDDEDTEENTDEEEEDTNLDVQITFLAPAQGEVISTTRKLIRWSIDDTANINNLKLEYSSDSEQWFEIDSALDPNRNYYIWDVSNLLDNDYFLKITAEGDNDQKVEQISQRFSINTFEEEDGEDDSSDDDTESSPLIINTKPDNDATITDETKVAISGDFIPAEGEEIIPDTFEITIDGEDFSSNCTVDQNSFLCTPAEDFASGKHSVNVSIKDTSDQKAEFEWTFNIETSDESDQNSNEEDKGGILGIDFSKINRNVLLLIACIIILLLLIPWIIYSLWKNRDDESTTTTTTFTPTAPVDNYVTYPPTNVIVNQEPPLQGTQEIPIYQPVMSEPINPDYNNYIIPYPTEPLNANPQNVTNNYEINPVIEPTSQPSQPQTINNYEVNPVIEPTPVSTEPQVVNNYDVNPVIEPLDTTSTPQVVNNYDLQAAGGTMPQDTSTPAVVNNVNTTTEPTTTTPQVVNNIDTTTTTPATSTDTTTTNNEEKKDDDTFVEPLQTS